MYQMLSRVRKSICVPANYSGSQYSDHPFIPNLLNSQPCLCFFFFYVFLCSTILSHLSCFCVISVSFIFFLLLLLPADVSPRRRILNVSRSVWKQANVASDLWEKLTARCVDRHRSASIASALGPEPWSGLRRFNCLGFLINLHGYCVRYVSTSTVGEPRNQHCRDPRPFYSHVLYWRFSKLSLLFFFIFLFYTFNRILRWIL